MHRYDRTRAPFFVAALAAAALAACSDAPTGAAPDSTGTYARQVAALGFRADLIEDHGDFLLVEGDIHLSKAQLRTVPVVDGDDPLRPSFQYRTNNLVTPANVFDITVNVAGLASQPGWQTAAREALTHWSGIPNSYVRMVEGSAADITVVTTCMNAQVAAMAKFPSGGNTGDSIFVNTCFGWSTSHAQKVHNMVHELGHALGLRHSNFQQLGESAGTLGAVHVFGTPTSGNDGGSVMNGGTALNSWAGFSSADRTAARGMYPLPKPVVSVANSGGRALISWTAPTGASSYTVSHYVSYSDVDRETHETYSSSAEYVLGNTTATSWLDTGNVYTGQSQCNWSSGYLDSQEIHWYYVTAHFANGTSSGGLYAPVAPC